MKCKKCNEKEAIKYSKYTSGEFCSKECSRSYSTMNDKNIKKIIYCYSCGKSIQVDKRCDSKRTRCEECKIKFKNKVVNKRGKKEIKKCKNCENEFLSLIKNGGIFCSRKCHFEYRKINSMNEEEIKYSNVLYQKKCKYKLSEEEYSKLMLIENCMICNKKLGIDENEHKCIDHDHDTNKVRGVLCHSCNRGLGFFHDSIENLTKAIKYLKSSLKTASWSG